MSACRPESAGDDRIRCGSVPRTAPSGLVLAAALIHAAAVIGTLPASESFAAVSGRSDLWHVESVGISRACDGCEPEFAFRATAHDGDSYAFELASRDARRIDAVHVSRDRALIVAGFESAHLPYLHRVTLYRLSRGGDARGDLLASDLSVSPDGRYLLYRPALARGLPADRRLFLWDTRTGVPYPLRRPAGCRPWAPCPPDLGKQLFPRPARPDAPNPEDPPPYPLRHTLWVMECEECWSDWQPLLAFPAIDRTGWLSLIVANLSGADSEIACYIPFARYREETRGFFAADTIKGLWLDQRVVRIEMLADAGTTAEYSLRMARGCRREREFWGEAHAELNHPALP